MNVPLTMVATAVLTPLVATSALMFGLVAAMSVLSVRARQTHAAIERRERCTDALGHFNKQYDETLAMLVELHTGIRAMTKRMENLMAEKFNLHEGNSERWQPVYDTLKAVQKELISLFLLKNQLLAILENRQVNGKEIIVQLSLLLDELKYKTSDIIFWMEAEMSEQGTTDNVLDHFREKFEEELALLHELHTKMCATTKCMEMCLNQGFDNLNCTSA